MAKRAMTNNTSMDEEQAAAAAMATQDMDKLDQIIGGATCDTCEQEYGEPDKDSPSGELLKWVKLNVLANECKKVAGRECYFCGYTRRKEYSGRGQEDLLSDFNKKPKTKYKFSLARSNYVKGSRHAKKLSNSERSVTIREKKGTLEES